MLLSAADASVLMITQLGMPEALSFTVRETVGDFGVSGQGGSALMLKSLPGWSGLSPSTGLLTA